MTPDYKITSAKYSEGFISMVGTKTNEAYVPCKLARTNKTTNQTTYHWAYYAVHPWLMLSALGTEYNVAVSKMQDITQYLNSMDTENVYSFIQ